jgi:glucose-1-phosphate thymidylyltransferase
MSDFLSRFRSPNALLAAYDIGSLEKAKAFGTVIVGSDGNTIAAFEEKPKEPKTTFVSTGASILPENTLPLVIDYAKRKPDNVGGIFEEFLQKNIAVDCFTFREPWFDIGSFDAYLEATRMLVGDRLIADGAAFDHSKQEGSVVLGKGTRVTNSTLRNVVVFDNCIIDDCILEDCVIDSNCRLTRADITGKMIREGTRLERKEAF